MGKLNIEEIIAILVVFVLLAMTAILGSKLQTRDKELAALQAKYDGAQQQIGKLELATKQQNDAVQALEGKRQEAEAKSDAAWAAVRQQTGRIDSLMKGLAGKKAVTCAEAMPALRQALQGAPL